MRINTLKTSEEDALKKLEQENITIEKVPQLKHTYKLVHTKKPHTPNPNTQRRLVLHPRQSKLPSRVGRRPQTRHHRAGCLHSTRSQNNVSGSADAKQGNNRFCGLLKTSNRNMKKETTRMDATNRSRSLQIHELGCH
jgi:hypothetical protein